MLCTRQERSEIRRLKQKGPTFVDWNSAELIDDSQDVLSPFVVQVATSIVAPTKIPRQKDVVSQELSNVLVRKIVIMLWDRNLL